ncbi:hypothetical protein DUPY_43910 [Duganella phyllosphaerae]|uniref:Uncharacterized protein n=1 Tax=Duganella phyllosphaerae TaxID=762836 RepID=A0A1E7WCG1_9BURK|nr:hypothetical protein DUPY_43910 [Duganella phyllosphaerae]
MVALSLTAPAATPVIDGGLLATLDTATATPATPVLVLPMTLFQSSPAVSWYVAPPLEAVPLRLNSAAIAATSAPARVTENEVALVTSTLPVVTSVWLAPPSPRSASLATVMSLAAPSVATRLLPVTVSTWVVAS